MSAAMQGAVSTVDAYLDEAPQERPAALERLRAMAVRLFPDAAESIEYGMPVFKSDGVMRVAFASQKHYIGVYGLGAEIVERYRGSLRGVDLGKSCLKCRKPDAIDFALLEAMLVEARDDGRSTGR